MTTIRFDSAVPAALHEELRALMAPYLPLVDREIERINVYIDGETGGEAAISVRRPYHFATIMFDNTFFGLEQEAKEHVVAHEMMHVFVDVFTREMTHLLEAFVPEDLEEYASARLEDVEERMTNTLAIVVGGLVRRLRDKDDSRMFGKILNNDGDDA